jgi:rubrerythrin
MSRDIDFADLSLQDTLDLAVAIEEEARERYLEFVDQMSRHHTPEAAQFFDRIASSELTHAERIRKRRHAIFGQSEVTVDRSLVYDVEAPEYHQVRAFMTVHRALEVALESERKAFRFYDRALETVDDAEVRRLFEDLREQEVLHQQLILEFRERLPDEDDADPDDYVDEPQPM